MGGTLSDKRLRVRTLSVYLAFEFFSEVCPMTKFAFRAALVALGLTVAVPALAADPDRLTATLSATGVSDYRFRGISQTDTAPALQLGAEGAFKFNDMLSGYIGVWGSNVDFNNDAKAEVDAMGGFRWTFDKLILDTGVIR